MRVIKFSSNKRNGYVKILDHENFTQIVVRFVSFCLLRIVSHFLSSLHKINGQLLPVIIFCNLQVNFLLPSNQYITAFMKLLES